MSRSPAVRSPLTYEQIIGIMVDGVDRQACTSLSPAGDTKMITQQAAFY